MNPVEILMTGLAAVIGSAIVGAIGFVYREILTMKIQLARIEEHLQINPTTIPIKKSK